MGKAFFYLRKSTEKKPQLIYVGLRVGSEQVAVSTGIKINPKRWDSDKGKVKQSANPFEVLLPPSLDQKCRTENKDVVSFTNNYLFGVADFANQKSDLPKDLLSNEIKAYINGRNELEQLAFDLDLFVRQQISIEGMTKEKLITVIDAYLRPTTGKITLLEYIE